MSDRRALVTGASGFIGSRLVEALVEEGWAVRASGRRARPPGLPGAVEYAPSDLAVDDLGPLVEGMSVVFHLAGASSSLSSDEEMQRVNVTGTARLVDALPPGVHRFVHMSSTSVYGEEWPLKLPVEEDAAGTPSRSYGKAKWEAEEAVAGAGRAGRPVVILRPVTVYGPGAVKLLASAALDVAIERRMGLDTVLAPASTIEQRLVHVDDVIAASLHLAEHEEAVGRAFNVAALYPTSDEVAAVLADAFSMSSRTADEEEAEPGGEDRRDTYDSMRADGMTDNILFTPERFRFLRKANLNNRLSSAALESTGFAFTHTDLATSVAGTIDWYRSQRWLL